MTDTVIRVENLYKEYRLGTISHGTLYRDLQSWWARIRGKEDPNSIISSIQPSNHPTVQPSTDNPHFLALRDVSFEVKRGEVLGIIGRNGAGKSTLLKILSEVTSPTKGTVKIKGRVASLLEVGTGFHPELTGRENIFLNGAILGMRKEEIKRKFDEIVAFAEVEQFIDTPVKRYSSGMYVRLAFAVAAHLDPEILIVDEVLAVGDAQFQKKCLGKMGEVAQGGRTVLFVSHNMSAVKGLCKKAVLFNDGNLVKIGSADSVVNDYIAIGLIANTEKVWDTIESAPGGDEVRIKRICLRVLSDNENEFILNDRSLEIGVEFWSLKDNQDLSITLHFLTIDGAVIFSTSTIHHPTLRGKRLSRGLFIGICRVPPNFLNDEIYNIRLLVVQDQANVAFQMDNALTFEVADSCNYRDACFGKRPGLIAPLLSWEMNSMEHGEVTPPPSALLP